MTDENLSSTPSEAEVGVQIGELPQGVENNAEEQIMKTMAKEAEERLAAKMQAESQYNTAYGEFQSSQDKILKEAESQIPPICPTCQSAVRSDKDKVSIQKNNACFSCFTESEEHRTEAAKEAIATEGTSRIGSLDLSDYEDWLLGDEMGQRSLARIMTKLKREGYDYKPWQVSIGAAAWSKDNYNNTSLVDTRHIVERIRISDLVEYMPQDTDGIQQVIASVKRAEEFIASEAQDTTKPFPYLFVGGASLIAIMIPYLLRGR